jgi:DNA polymerase-3 subunit alpha
MPNEFVHLHNHTQYSLLDGLTRVPDLVDRVQEFGMSAVAMTDHGTLSGAIEFYKEATAKAVKPLIGMETYVAARQHTDKGPQKDKQRYHLILLAMDSQGYKNLMQLSTIANLEGFYYHPRVDHELLEKYNQGLIVLSACMGGEIGSALKEGQTDKAKEIASWYKKVFGDRYYLEIQDHGHPENPLHSPEQRVINEQILALGKELDIPVALTCDAHYLRHEDQDAHEILLCVGTGAFLSEEKRMSLKDFPLHVEDPEEIIKRWGKDYPEVVKNTKKIADRCRVGIELDKILIPKFPVPKGESEESYLTKLVYQGLARRYSGQENTEQMTVSEAKKHLPKNVAERAVYELDIISNMEFNGYFLIVQDFINWGKNRGIVFGPGRGSAAGSIIAYALNITDLDPLKYDLLFERFLNPDRISMPDVDIDIQDTRRDEVIRYCAEKYGEDRVASIVTFGRMFARNAVRDVARVLQVPYAEADRLAKMIPAPVQGKHIPLKKSVVDDADLKREYESNQTSKKIIDEAMVLEGTVRSHGVHACGVVIAPDDLVKYLPLEKAQKGVVTTQYPMGHVEELGLLKMDFLGLSNLTIINNCLRIIRKVYKNSLDIAEIPLDDQKTYELFQRGDTTGVFQFESAGMKRYLKQLKPTVFEDLIAMVALYRPGPMQFIDDFIGRKSGEKNITYFHPKMENALKTTYGVLVYQEQVMQISKEVCGFTGGEADTLRKAIGKKKADLMAKMKEKMIEGGQKNSGVPKDQMEQFWKQLEDFAAYCFNKSHAACYAMIAYWTAYLKAHYPSAYMAALMTSDFDDIDRLAIEINECKHMGIEVLPPDVTESFAEFAIVPKEENIRFGMHAVKNVGGGAVEEIVRAREENAFDSLEDFLARVNVKIVNRKALESLIKSGALDRYGARRMLLDNLDALLAFAVRVQKDQQSGQADLFGDLTGEAPAVIRPPLKLAESGAGNQREWLQWERELLGLYLSQHPLEIYKTFLMEQATPIADLQPGHDGKSVNIGGIITDIREITTKNGQKMAFVKIADLQSETELLLFPNSYQRTTGLWEQDKVLLVRGKVNAKDRDGNLAAEVKIMVDDAREITAEQASLYQATGKKLKQPRAKSAAARIVQPTKPRDPGAAGMRSSVPAKVYVRLDNTGDQTLLLNLKQAIDANTGSTDVVLVLGSHDARQAIKLPGGVNPASEALKHLQSLVGSDNVKLQ